MILSLVLFLALPMSLLVLVETEKMKSEIRQEVRQLKKLKQELKELKDVTNRSGNRSQPD